MKPENRIPSDGIPLSALLAIRAVQILVCIALGLSGVAAVVILRMLTRN